MVDIANEDVDSILEAFRLEPNTESSVESDSGDETLDIEEGNVRLILTFLIGKEFPVVTIILKTTCKHV
jgi:hypothetical protein